MQHTFKLNAAKVQVSTRQLQTRCTDVAKTSGPKAEHLCRLIIKLTGTLVTQTYLVVPPVGGVTVSSEPPCLSPTGGFYPSLFGSVYAYVPRPLSPAENFNVGITILPWT